MHWLYSAAIVVGFVFVIVVGLISVLHDLIAIDDGYLNADRGRRRRTSTTRPEVPSPEIVNGADCPSSGPGVHEFE